MQSFFLSGIKPKLHMRIFFVQCIRKKKRNAIDRRCLSLSVSVHECCCAGEQDKRHGERQLGLEHLFHGATLTFEHASGLVSLACPTFACTAWNAASSNTFQFELKRRGSARESQQLALSVSSNFRAAIATSPHGCGSSFLSSHSAAKRLFQLCHAFSFPILESRGISASQGYTCATTSG